MGEEACSARGTAVNDVSALITPPRLVSCC